MKIEYIAFLEVIKLNGLLSARE